MAKRFILMAALAVLPTAALAGVFEDLGGESKEVGPAGVSVQVTGSTTANAPSSSTDGISLKGACRIRAVLGTTDAGALGGSGTGVWWVRDETLTEPRWVENKVTTWSITSTGRDEVYEANVGVPYGRAYLEADNVAATKIDGGTTTLTVRLSTMSCSGTR